MAAVAMLAIFGACDRGGKKAGETTLVPPPSIIRPAPLRRRTMDRTLEISGAAAALVRSEVSARTSNLAIVEVRADVGDAVASGDVLCRLDPTEAARELKDSEIAEREAAARIREAEASKREIEVQIPAQDSVIAQASKAYERAKTQASGGAIAAEVLDNAKYGLDKELAAKARLAVQVEKATVAVDLAKRAAERAETARKKAEQNLEWTEVRAPYAGVVSKRFARLGAVVGAGAALFEMFDPNSIAVESQVTQKDLADVAVGQPVRLRADAFVGAEAEGVVSLVAPAVDETAGTIPIRITVPDASGLKPGLFVSGRIVLSSRPDVLVAPKKAILYERERPYVFVLKPDPEPGFAVVKRVEFREGLADREDVEAVFDDGAPRFGVDDRVVLVGQDRLRDGDRVAVEGESNATRPAVDAASRPENGR